MKNNKHKFVASIYKTGINWAVDVPVDVTRQMTVERGYIRIRGTINGFEFRKSLVPVKDSCFRLFVNLMMMKGGKTSLGKEAVFEIELDTEPKKEEIYEMPDFLIRLLSSENLMSEFSIITAARKRDILRYLHQIKTLETRQKNLEKLIQQLKSGKRDVRIP